MKVRFWSALLFCLMPMMLAAQNAPLRTHGERSAYRETGRYEEVIALCNAFAQRHPKRIRCRDFGRSPEGRPLKSLIVTGTGVFDAKTAVARKIPVVLIQGGIHAGEIDGKDAIFLALHRLMDGEVDSGALDKSIVLFVPVFSADGHERFKAWNRPNQRGPAEMGWRATAQNFNLNRDYLKADAPEMQAMLRLIGEWDPLLVVDLHTTDGAKFQHDISITTQSTRIFDADLHQASIRLRDEIIDGLRRDGALPVDFYPSFVENDVPTSGFVDYPATPRFSSGYLPLRNRMSILVETHSWRTYPERVERTYQTILHTLSALRRDGLGWRRIADAADARAAAIGGSEYPLTWRNTKDVQMIDFLGYAYTRTPSEISGALMTHYDESVKQTWRVPILRGVQSALSVQAPRAGYLVPAAYAKAIGAHLDLHGIRYRRLENARRAAPTQTFRASKASFASAPVESHQRLTVEGEWKPEAMDLPAGSLFVPIAQAKSQLVLHLFEPRNGDSYLAWGLFNAHFEQKEYMEDYVAEEVAREMLAKDAALKAEFEKRLREDEAFAKNPAARLQFFYQRHSAWDDRFQLYPVYRMDTAP